MANLSKDQVVQIIQNRPQGSTPDEIVNELIGQGHTLEGYVPPPKEEKTIGGFIQNAAESGKNFLGGIKTAITHPIDTFEAATKLGIGALGAGIEKMIPPEQRQITPEEAATPTGKLYQESRNLFGKVAEDYKNAYGSKEAALNTAYQDPFRVAGDASAVLTAGGGLISKVGKVSDVGALAKTGEIVTATGEAINPANVVTKPLGAALPYAGRAATELLGKSTGAGTESILNAFNDPNVVKYARKAGPSGAIDLQQQALEDAMAGLNKIKQDRSKNYVSALENIKTNSADVGKINAELHGGVYDIRSQAMKKLADPENGFGVKITRDGENLSLDFSDSTIVNNTGIVKKAFNDVMRWKDTTPVGLDKLKKRLAQVLDEIPQTESGGARAFVTELKGNVSQLLKEKVPGYSDMVGNYEQASNLIDDIQKSLSLKDKTSMETSIRKLQGALRENNELRRDFLKQLSKEAGTNIEAKLSGAQVAPLAPRGLAGTLQAQVLAGGTAAVNAGFVAAHIPQIVIGLAATSPRLVAELTTILGKGSRIAKKITPEQSKQILLLLQKAGQMDSTSD